METSHDQNFTCKIMKIWCKTCVFCCKKFPITTCILFLFFLSYLFFPWVFTFLIYSTPLVGLSFVVHKVLLGIDGQKKIKRVEEDDRRKKCIQVEEDDRRKKFAKSRRSFKSKYGDRSRLIHRKANVEDKDDIFSKTLNDLLFAEKNKKIEDVNVESIVGRGECSSSNDSQSISRDIHGNFKANYKELPQDNPVGWTEDDQKNVMDLGLSEADRNKRLESLITRRKSRKNLGFQEKGVVGNNNNNNNNSNVQVSAIKIAKVNPFLEDNSCGKKSPGSAPSWLIATHNPFDIPYDPYEEKPDLTGDNFHEEFMVGHQKEPMFCRHESFSLGAFSHPQSTHDKHDIPSYKDFATNHKSITEIGTSTIGGNINHPKEGDGTVRRTQEIGVNHDEEESDFQKNVDSYNERKADIVFFYGGNKRLGHAPSNSVVSDLQVEVSDEGSIPILDDLDVEKDKGSGLNLSNLSEGDVEVVKDNAKNSEIISNQTDHIPESSRASQSSMAQTTVPDEVAVRQAPVNSSSPKSVLQRESSTDPSSPYNIANEVQQSDNHTRDANSSDY